MAERNVIELSQLRPTQITVGMLQVQQKRKKLQSLKKRPCELIDFILERPIRVVLGPKNRAYVIDHHHLALALIKENFESAPMDVEENFSALTVEAFWKKMRALRFVHPYDAKGIQASHNRIPNNLKQLTDDPYRSLAGFVREAGGYAKVQTPYAEFVWADFYRRRIKKKLLKKNFDKALKHALVLANSAEAKKLPGYQKPSGKTK